MNEFAVSCATKKRRRREDAVETARLRAQLAAAHGTPEQRAMYGAPAPF
ncbi:hypothetical protein [Streptomyces agglomeratus]|nr:hypothetical protein [Streptomyces agglomeratus]